MNYGTSKLALSEACERNQGPIGDILKIEFVHVSSVLEIGSGTGQHAVHFAKELPQCVWQPTERPVNLPALHDFLSHARLPNLALPRALDVAEPTWTTARVGGIFTANTLHIMSWVLVEKFFAGVERALDSNGVVCVYGPFRYGDAHTSTSNEAFDVILRQRDSASGVRDFEAIDALAKSAGLHIRADHAMPANNRLLVWSNATGCDEGLTRR